MTRLVLTIKRLWFKGLKVRIDTFCINIIEKSNFLGYFTKPSEKDITANMASVSLIEKQVGVDFINKTTARLNVINNGEYNIRFLVKNKTDLAWPNDAVLVCSESDKFPI